MTFAAVLFILPARASHCRATTIVPIPALSYPTCLVTLSIRLAFTDLFASRTPSYCLHAGRLVHARLSVGESLPVIPSIGHPPISCHTFQVREGGRGRRGEFAEPNHRISGAPGPGSERTQRTGQRASSSFPRHRRSRIGVACIRTGGGGSVT